MRILRRWLVKYQLFAVSMACTMGMSFAVDSDGIPRQATVDEFSRLQRKLEALRG